MAAKKFRVNWPNGLKVRKKPEPTLATYTGVTLPDDTVVEAIKEPRQYDERFTFQKVRLPDGEKGWLTYRDGATTYLVEVEEAEAEAKPKPEPSPEPVKPPPPTPTPAAEPVKPTPAPPATTEYVGGTAFQYDKDDPVRPAHLHADKNIKLRGYRPNPKDNFERELVNYGVGDETSPPQVATLFDPPRVPPFTGFYRVDMWDWKRSPKPGTRGKAIKDFPVTAIGLQTTPGEALCVPTSGYDIGGGLEVVVIYADESTIALKYARQDSAGAPGYTVHVDKINIDPNLLALYKKLDDPNGPRYVYPNETYDLPTLSAGQPFGTASGTKVVVVMVDTGGFMDIRSCDDWWQIRPGYTGSCPRPRK